MTRYDWPAPPRRRDDPEGRGAHLDRYRPPASVQAPEGVAPEAPPSATFTRPIFADAPAGNRNLWFPIGPSVMTNGQASGTPEVAGRVRDLQVEPAHGQRVYAASASGGVWYSSDRGASWRPLDEFVESPNRDTLTPVGNALACGAIQVRWGAADDGSQDEVWVGTGEQAGGAGGLPGGALAGIGILHALGPAAGTAWSVDATPTPPRGTAVFRIANDPGRRDQLVAGTTDGLYAWPPGGPWAKVAGWNTAAGNFYPIDVVMTRPDLGHLRIWVAAFGTLYVSEFAGDATTPITPATLTFQPVTLNHIESRRIQLAKSDDGTRLFVLGLRKATGDEKAPVAHLWSVDPTATLAGLSGTELPGLPPRMFMSTGDQSGYDMCIAVHPDVTSRVYVGGAAIVIDGEWNGAIYRCETTASAVDPTLIGEGVHPDVHVLRVGPKADTSASDRTVWVGCDGGVFRSDAGGDSGTFRSRNDGLAVLEPGFVASHPTNAGIVVAGFQDNGTAERIGDSLWRQKFRGDGGGVVFDPANAGRYYRQYTSTQWDSSDGGGIQPVQRRQASGANDIKTSEQVEGDTSERRRAVLLGLRRGRARRRHPLRHGNQPRLVHARLGPLVGHVADRDGSARPGQPRPRAGPPRSGRTQRHLLGQGPHLSLLHAHLPRHRGDRRPRPRRARGCHRSQVRGPRRQRRQPRVTHPRAVRHRPRLARRHPRGQRDGRVRMDAPDRATVPRSQHAR